MTKHKIFAVAGLSTMLLASSAVAEDYPQRALLKRSSLSTGLSNTAPTLLARNPGDRTSARTALLAVLCGTCQTTETSSPSGTRIESADWVLDLEGDGTYASFQRKDGEARSSQLGRPSAARMSKTALERAGRAFIADKLAGTIALAPDEQLVALTAAYRIEGGQDLVTKAMAPDMVVANRVVFGRTIRGVLVVGGGSTVTVTFANDGSIESFRYDWPSYSPTSIRRTAAAPREIVARVQRVIAARSPRAASQMTPAISSYPVALSPQAQLQDLECGYFDPGLQRRDPSASIQTGCTYHVVETISGTSRAGHGGAVPAGLAIEPDAAWPEAALLTGTTR